ncbi:MAG TPA: hypothetical protein VHR40_09700 [Thermoleophilaceae bacterium]|nr:hypothetical protein [Thermoleophilaceae bacterium]
MRTPAPRILAEGNRQRVRAEGPVPAPVHRVLDEPGASPAGPA